jgi:hypothetical protein
VKSREQITAETQGKPKNQRQFAPPPGYVPHAKLTEWEPAKTQLSRDEFIRRVVPMHDRILVQLILTKREGSIALTDPEPLIGGCRKAVVLKTGPGRWVPGEWWHEGPTKGNGIEGWFWYPGYRRPVDVLPGQTVLIGNWVDLEVEDIALCQEADIRTRVDG